MREGGDLFRKTGGGGRGWVKEERGERRIGGDLIPRLFFGSWPPPSFRAGFMLLSSLAFLQG